MPKFSIIMQSYLEPYQGAASNRDEKIIRAVESVINQTFKDWELIIVADGCEKTFNIISEKYLNNDKINCFLIPKQPFWSGTARDIGKLKATGDYCLYLDTDDYYSKTHLEDISKQLAGFDWVFYNDMILVGKEWRERPCFIRRIGHNGTSNVCFKRSLNVSWSTFTGYAHDFVFNQQLVKASANHAQIKAPGYYVCHLPPHQGNKGYDV